MVEFDTVDFSNLQRQIIHFTGDVGKPKVQSAGEKMKAINAEPELHPARNQITSDNALDLIKDYDIVVDGTDNFPTRYLVNDACVHAEEANVYGSIFRFEGMASVFAPHLGGRVTGAVSRTATARPRPELREGGVLGVNLRIIGNIQPTKPSNSSSAKGKPLMGRLLRFDAMDMSFREYKIPKDPNCPLCGKNPTITKLIDYLEFCGIGRGEEGAHPVIPSWTKRKKASAPTTSASRPSRKCATPKKTSSSSTSATLTNSRISVIDGSVKLPLPELPQRFRETTQGQTTHRPLQDGWPQRPGRQLPQDPRLHEGQERRRRHQRWAERIDTNVPQY